MSTSTHTVDVPISELMARRAHEAAERLEENPFYARLLDGAATREEYAAWLVQMHKYVRFTCRSLRGLVGATAGARAGSEEEVLHGYAQKEAREEAGHDELIVRDLACLWGTSPNEALGRIERAPTSPAAVSWMSQLDTLVAQFPEGIVGAAVVLETIAALHADRIRVAMVERDPSLEGATTFLGAHRAEVEAEHNEEGREQADKLVGARARGAAYYYASAALSMFEGLAWYLHERHALAERGA